jgi:hypothetical protein
MDKLKTNLERFKKLREEMPDLFVDMVKEPTEVEKWNESRMIKKYNLTHDAYRVKVIYTFLEDVEKCVSGKITFEELSDIVSGSGRSRKVKDMINCEVKSTDEYKSIIRKIDESTSKMKRVIDVVKEMDLTEEELTQVGLEIMGMASEIRFEKMKRERESEEK